MTKRPKARLKIGRKYTNDKHSYIAQGFVIFKEWDAGDNKYYYWEEWELTGFDNYDCWIEYDHYSKNVTVYEPVRANETYDVLQIAQGEDVVLTTKNGVLQGKVAEKGSATIAALKGKMSYQLFPDDVIHYAEVKTGPNSVVSIEDYRQTGDRDYDYYLGTRLSKVKQKEFFGRVITPWSANPSQVFVAIFALFIFLPNFIPSYETICTPRTTIPRNSTSTISTNQISSQPDTPTDNVQQECQRVRVYGGAGGGGGK